MEDVFTCFFIIIIVFLSVSIGRRWYLPKGKATHLFPASTVPLALLCQPRRFAISMGIWRQSPNKSAGAMGGKASVDERSETVDKIFILLMVSSFLNILFSKPCSRYSWPQVIKSFIFFWLETERQEHLILSATGNADKLPLRTHIHSVCECVCVCARVGLCVPRLFVTCRTMLFFPKRQPLSLHLSSSPDESRMLKRKGRRGLWETAPQVDEAAGVLLTVCVWPLIEYLVVIPAGTPI